MARERYLLNSGDETIHKDEIVLTTNKEKRKNFWHYHKWYFIAGAVSLVFLIYCIYSAASNVKPDYEVALLTQENFSEPLADQLSAYLAQYGEDRNGNGKVDIQINRYQLYTDSNYDDSDQAMDSLTGSVRLSADIMSGYSMIFIADEKSFKDVLSYNHDSLDFFVDTETYEKVPEDETDKNRVSVRFGDCAGLDAFEIVIDSETVTSQQVKEIYFDDLTISMRTVEGSTIEDDEEIAAYYEDCKALFERMKNG